MHQLPSTCIIVIISCLVSFTTSSKDPPPPEKRIGLYNGDDASAILQAAFAQAGVDLDGGGGGGNGGDGNEGDPGNNYETQTRRPSIFSRLRNFRFPSLLPFSRRRVTPMPSMTLIPIVAAPPDIVTRASKGNTNGVLQVKGPTFVTTPYFHVHPAGSSPYHQAMKQHPPPNQIQQPPTDQSVAVSNPVVFVSHQENKPAGVTIMKTSASDASHQFIIVKPTPQPIPLFQSTPTSTVPTLHTTQMSSHVPKAVKVSKARILQEHSWIPSYSYSRGMKTIPKILSHSSSPSSSSSHRSVSSMKSDTKPSSHDSFRPIEKKSSSNPTLSGLGDFWRLNDSMASESVNDVTRMSRKMEVKNPYIIKSSSGGKKSIVEKYGNISPSALLEQISRLENAVGRKLASCSNKNLGWCDYSPDSYPEPFVLAVIKECRDVIERMYVEVPQNLAEFDDYIPFTPITNFNANETAKSPSPTKDPKLGVHATWSWANRKKASLCDSERKFVRPSVAQDITGRWFIIVQSSLYHQQIPVDLCKNPGEVCNNVSSCGLSTRCVQRFNTQLLISIDLDKEHDCPNMRLYRFPSGCVCDHATYY